MITLKGLNLIFRTDGVRDHYVGGWEQFAFDFPHWRSEDLQFYQQTDPEAIFRAGAEMMPIWQG